MQYFIYSIKSVKDFPLSYYHKDLYSSGSHQELFLHVFWECHRDCGPNLWREIWILLKSLTFEIFFVLFCRFE